MAMTINSIQHFLLKPQSPFTPHRHKHKSANFNKPLTLTNRKPRRWHPIKSCISNQEIDMVRTRGGVYTAKAKKVVVLWDLDNKPPRGPPYEAALALKSVAQKFGDVIDISAYANRHAFIHLPQWVVEERRERRNLDFLERKGLSTPSDPYICSVCGRKFKTNMDLKKHFRQLHERERQKKMNRMRSLKGKKRQRFKERFIDGNEKYNEAARDDSDFSETLRKAREANLGTVVVGDMDRALGKHADVWVPWIRVENGEIEEGDLALKRRESGEFDERFSVSEFDGDLESADELVGLVGFNGSKVSSFSEGEDEDDDHTRARFDHNAQIMEDNDEDGEGDYFSDSDDEELQEQDDVYF